MAKAPKKKAVIQSNTKAPAKNKRTDKRAPKPKRAANTDNGHPAPAECECCAACDALPTGTWGIPWRRPDGTWDCLPGPAVGEKKLIGDPDGPDWANP